MEDLTHFPSLLSIFRGGVKCFLFLGRPLPRLLRLLLSSSCCCRSLTHTHVMSSVPLLLYRVHVYRKSHGSPLVSASLQFAQISLLLLVRLLQLSQVDAVLYFHRIQYIQRHFTKQLKGPEKSVTFSKRKHFCLNDHGSSAAYRFFLPLPPAVLLARV